MAVIVVVAGVSGSGKSTVGAMLAGRLGWDFTDGDALHPAANIDKMSRGVPLTDQDRMPWLRAIGGWMDDQVTAGRSAVVACSALKHGYRDLLLDGRPQVRIAFLQVDRDVLARRLAVRHGHFFDPRLLDSQFADLEPPGPDEQAVTVVTGSSGGPDRTVTEIIDRLELWAGHAPGPDSGSAGAGASALAPGTSDAEGTSRAGADV
ncbi:MAG: gluconokinase [Actinomycetota bacterium]|nr:gluconokinase [Actinomycetota bacterium]